MSKNVENLGGAPENDEMIYGKVRGQEFVITKALRFILQVCSR